MSAPAGRPEGAVRGSAGAVLFDLDGTLVDREPLARRALVDVCAAAGYAVPESSAASVVGRAWQDVYAALAVGEHTGWSVGEMVTRVVGRSEELVAHGFVTPPLPGGAELVRVLSVRGIRCGLVTGSTRRETEAAVADLGLGSCFDIVVTADDYQRGKPAPDPYALAVRSLAGATATRTVAIEDSAAGIAAARSAGLHVVATEAANPPAGHPAHQDLGRADLVVVDLLHTGLVGWIEARVAE